MSNILKCKMCGGDITINNDKTHGTCEFCGSVMTFPKVDDEQRLATFNRGNQFRRAGEFDKAILLYEQLIRDDDKDAEAHWCCALSRFGIEYVEDPTTLEYIPTCHRASIDSFLEDVDYLAAVKYSDGITQKQYQKDAMKIAEVQRGILATSQNEEPFDIFICYKESDANGDRTIDSSLAQDIYYQLTDAGYKVFFSRITLEDKVGSEYEPYIFAALNSAKVMVVVGTSKENLDAVWVKNEWSRYLSLMRKDRKRVILPCYRDMDPYDMPEALSVLQSYDMSKIGFIQDLVRGIKKVVDAEQTNQTSKETIVVQQNVTTSNGNDIENSIKRAKLALEDKNWDEAKKFCERILDSDAENGYAYLLLFMASEKVSAFDEVVAIKKDIEKNKDFEKAARYLKGEVANEIQTILDTRKEIENQQAYDEASKYIKGFHPIKKKKTANTFEKLGEYKEASALSKKVGESARKDRRLLVIFIVLVIFLSAGSVSLFKYVLPEIRYKEALQYFENEQYADAEKNFEEIEDYKDSNIYKEKAHILEVILNPSKEEEFLDLNLGNFSDVDTRTREAIADGIKRLISENKMDEAETLINRYSRFEPVEAVLEEFLVAKINQLMEENRFDGAISEVEKLPDTCLDKSELLDKCYYLKAKSCSDAVDIVTYGLMANGYADSVELIKDNAEEALRRYLESGKLNLASKLFDYDIKLDNLEQIKELCEQYKKYDVVYLMKSQGGNYDTNIRVMPKIDLNTLKVKIVVSGFEKVGAYNLDSNIKWKCDEDKVVINYYDSGRSGKGNYFTEIKGYINVTTGLIDVDYRSDGLSYDGKYRFYAQGEQVE